MRKTIIIIFLIIGTINTITAQDSEMDKFIKGLMSKMTLEEKLGQLNLSSCAGNLPVISEGEGKENIKR